jgi:Zn finger protein HypA/HybF involved in hydrogenase expression
MMHEYAAVEELVGALARQVRERGVGRVTRVHLRRNSAFDPAALAQAWAMTVPGTPLAGATVEVTVAELVFACACGHRQVVTSDDLIGHMVVCPACGRPDDVAGTHDLEVVEVIGVPSAELEHGARGVQPGVAPLPGPRQP